MNLLFFDFGSGEIFLIVMVIFLVFGPDRIPEMARKFGKFINEIKRASEDIKNEINKEADKKEREKKLQEFREKIKNEDQISSTQPRKSTRIERIDSIDEATMQTGEGPQILDDEPEDYDEMEVKNGKDDNNQ